MSEFKVSIEKDERKIHFESPIDNSDCDVRIYEISTNFIIWKAKFNFVSGIDYWIRIGPRFDILNGILVKIFKNNSIIYQEKIIINEHIDYGNIYDFKNEFKYSENEKNSWAPFFEIFIRNDYEYNNIKVNKNDIVVDLGSNIGLFSLYSFLNGASKVYSMEPVKETYNILRDNLKKFNVNIMNVAISDFEKEIKFYLDDISGSSTIFPENQDRKYEIVKCIDINSFFKFNNLDRVNFMKIDGFNFLQRLIEILLFTSEQPTGD